MDNITLTNKTMAVIVFVISILVFPMVRIDVDNFFGVVVSGPVIGVFIHNILLFLNGAVIVTCIFFIYGWERKTAE